MRRILCLFTALILCIGLCACGNTVDATDIYTAAREKTDALTSFDSTMELSVKYTTFGELAGGNQSTVHSRLDRRTEGAPVYYSIYKIKDLSIGQEYNSSTYYADNVVYEMSAMGEKYMTRVSVESIESSFESVAIDVPAEVFERSRVNGNKVSVATDANNLKELTETFLSGVTNSYSSPNGDGKFDFDYSDVEIEFVTDDNGYFEYISIAFTADFEALEGKSKADVSLKMTYNKPGSDVDITPPDDLSEYTWYEGGDKTQEELEGEMMEEILAMFVFENGTATKVDNYDELYAIACSKYTKEVVDMYVQTIEAMGAMGGNK
ncbi:MAG: hypothetical protein IJB57_10310 [Clostridia bacterium]|nr:hypothetical protein [Clostridia bacterium]